MSKDKIYNKFKPNVYMKPDAYLNGWARKCGWKATIVYDSLWRHADIEGTSFPSIKLLADEHNVSRDTIMRGLKTLIDFNLVKKEAKRDKKGRFLHNVYTLTDKSEWVDASKSPTATRLSKSLTATTQVAHSDYKDTHNKDTHIERENKRERTLTLTKKSALLEKPGRYSSLDSLGEEEFRETAERYQVPVAFVRSCYDSLVNYCEAHGKRYKNYLAALRNFVKNDALKIKREVREHVSKRGIDARNVK